MITPKLVNEPNAAYIEHPLMSKRGLVLTILLGNIIFFLTIAFGNILTLFSPFWLVSFYIFAQLLVYADYKYGKRVGQFRLIFNKSEIGIEQTTGDWSTDHQKFYPLEMVKNIVFHQSTSSLVVLVGRSPKKYSLNPDIPLSLIVDLLEITSDKSGVPCSVVPKSGSR